MGNNVSTVVNEVRDFAGSIKSASMQKQIRASLPRSVSLDRFTTTTVTAINHSPELLKADRQSLYNAIVRCAADGLLPDGNDAVLTIYNCNVGTRDKPQWVKKAQYQRMVGGLLKQFVKAGIDAYAVSVHENDQFDIWNDNDGQHVLHRRAKFGTPRGRLSGVFACGRTKSGASYVEPMDIEEIDRVRAASQSSEGPAWKNWYDRMGQKSALHRLRKRIAIADDEAAAELGKIDEEFDTETGEIHGASQEYEAEASEASTGAQANQPEQEKRAQAGGQQRRPKALQEVVDADAPPSSQQGDDDIV